MSPLLTWFSNTVILDSASSKALLQSVSCMLVSNESLLLASDSLNSAESLWFSLSTNALFSLASFNFWMCCKDERWYVKKKQDQIPSQTASIHCSKTSSSVSQQSTGHPCGMHYSNCHSNHSLIFLPEKPQSQVVYSCSLVVCIWTSPHLTILLHSTTYFAERTTPTSKSAKHFYPICLWKAGNSNNQSFKSCDGMQL